MAQFMEQYTHAISMCDDYDSLTHEIEICISKNVLNHLTIDIKNAIDRLNLNTPFYKFIKMMTWASVASEHNENALNLLRYFCDKVVSQFDSLTMDLDSYSMMVIAICANDKSFINKLTGDQQFELVDAFCRWYLVKTDRDNITHIPQEICKLSISLILEGYTMDQLDKYFDKKYESIKITENLNYYDHAVNEIIRPFQALFINLTHNADQYTLLYQLCAEEWTNRVIAITKQRGKMFADKFNSSESADNYSWQIRNMLYTFKMFNDRMTTSQYTNFVNPATGEFLWAFLEGLHQAYSLNVTAEQMKLLVTCAQQIYYSNFYVIESARSIIDTCINKYCYSGEYEDALTKGDFLEAIKMHLRGDQIFLAWYEGYKDDTTEAVFDRVMSTYISKYLNPMLDQADFVMESLIATEAKNIRDRSEDTEDEEDADEDLDEEEPYDGPEIVAKQSTKGYKRMSKTQSDAERNIYKSYKKYKNNEAKVDSQLSKMLISAKKAFSQDKTEEIIEGKRFTPIGILKRALATAAIFSFSKIGAIVYLVVSHTLSKKRTQKQKNDILIQIDNEIKMLDEKIEDARGDGNRKAKYALMRTRSELVRARDKIKYNLSATKKDMETAKSYIGNDTIQQ